MNLANPMAMKGPYRELIPAGEQRVTLRTGVRKAKGVKLVSGAQATTLSRDTVAMTVIVPSLLDHEVIAIDWED